MSLDVRRHKFTEFLELKSVTSSSPYFSFWNQNEGRYLSPTQIAPRLVSSGSVNVMERMLFPRKRLYNGSLQGTRVCALESTSLQQGQDRGARRENKRNGMASLCKSLGGTILASHTEDQGSLPPFTSITLFFSIYLVGTMLGSEVTKTNDRFAKIHTFCISQEFV